MSKYEQAVKTWQSWQVRTAADLDLRLDNFRIVFAYHSGKLENEAVTYADTRELFENGRVVGYTGDPRAIFEQRNQKLCYDFLVEKLVAREPLSIPLILEIHRVLTEGTYDERRYVVNGERPGQFKKHDYVTGVHDVGAFPEDVEAEVTALLTEMNEAGDVSPLQAGAYFHAVLENIHPFADGNGRLGRTLLNYWLMIRDHPPTIIYTEDKGAYYLALQQYDEKETLEPLISFLEEQTVKTWQRSMRL